MAEKACDEEPDTASTDTKTLTTGGPEVIWKTRESNFTTFTTVSIVNVPDVDRASVTEVGRNVPSIKFPKKEESSESPLPKPQ